MCMNNTNNMIIKIHKTNAQGKYYLIISIPGGFLLNFPISPFHYFNEIMNDRNPMFCPSVQEMQCPKCQNSIT